MSAQSFRGISMVASCAAAALGCYLVSLRVASERAAVESVEIAIVMAKRDIRVLQTEIGTRGRLAQLERWNVKVLALSAPSADQILDGGFALAKLVAPPRKDEITAPVVLASAPANAPRPHVEGVARASEDEGVPTSALLHQTSLTRDIPGSERGIVVLPRSPVPAARKPAAKAVAKPAPRPDATLASVKPAKAATPKKLAPAAGRQTTTLTAKKAAAADPLAPLASPAKKHLASANPLKSSAREPARKP